MTYLCPKALLMVRPVKRVLVTRVPLVCHVSHSGCESYLCYVPGSGESTLCFEWLLRTQHLIGLASAKQGRSGEMQLVARIRLAFDDVARGAIPRGLERSSADRVPHGFDVRTMSTCPIRQQP